MNTAIHTAARGVSRPALTLTPTPRTTLQRTCPSGRCGEDRDDKSLRRQPRPGAQGAPGAMPSIVHDVLRASSRPLDPATRSSMESRFGHDFGGVRVHTDAAAAASARAVGALAYTVGRDIAFATGRYAPGTAEGRTLLAHELAHVVEQRGATSILQRQPVARPPTEADRREFIQDTTRFFAGSAEFYRLPQVAVTAALVERLLNTWYQMVVDRERMIDETFGGDRALRDELRAAYTDAVRALISRAVAALGRGEADLYRENRGRIPMWAWPTPHHLESGISTPIAQGRAADILTGEVSFAANGFDVTIAQDTVDPGLGDSAETHVDITRPPIPPFHWEQRGGRRIVTAFTPPGRPTVRIWTAYGSGVTAASTSGYGRGTTPEDIAGGRVTPRSTSLGFHEGSHGLDYVEFLETNPAPQFTGAVGMTVAEFQAAMAQYQADFQAYQQRIEAFSARRTDCVGTTIDQFNQGRGRVTRICRP